MSQKRQKRKMVMTRSMYKKSKVVPFWNNECWVDDAELILRVANRKVWPSYWNTRRHFECAWCGYDFHPKKDVGTWYPNLDWEYVCRDCVFIGCNPENHPTVQNYPWIMAGIESDNIKN